MVPGFSAEDAEKDRKLQGAAAALGEALPVPIDPEAFTRCYFARNSPDELAERAEADLAALMRAHLELGARREGDTDLISVVTPTAVEDGWSAQGSTVVQIVTTDRSFLVDTVLMDLTRRDWSIRHLHHPQFLAERDADGVLTSIAPREADAPGSPESWICLEIYPPLGRSADELGATLADELRPGLRQVRLAVEDWDRMRAHAVECGRVLDQTPQPVSPGRVRTVIRLLEWLADDHFAFLGYQRFAVEGERFTPVEGSALGICREDLAVDFNAIAPGHDGRELLVVTKFPRRSPVHRPSYLDYLGVRVFDEAGHIVGEHRFLGLLAATAYSESVDHIPGLAEKAHELEASIGFDPDSHGGHVVRQVVNTYPRDELFQAKVAELAPIVETVVNLQERRQVRLFVRADRYGRFVSCTIYLPRDRYNTAVRTRIAQILMDALDAETLEHQVQVSESVLARLFFVVKLPDGARAADVDVAGLERRIAAATRSWDDEFNAVADELPAQERGVEFGEAYESVFDPAVAVEDLRLANALDPADDGDLQFSIAPDAERPHALRFKVFTRRPMSLTEVLPHLGVLGVEVTDERPFEWDLRGDRVHVYDFGLRLPDDLPAEWDADDRARFRAAFAASYRGLAHPGKMNRLVMTAKLTWQQVSWLRGIGRYLQQAGIPFSQFYVADALTEYPAIAAALVDAFETKFDPARGGEVGERAASFEEKARAIEKMLDDVASLDQDRILRMYVAVLRAVVRTNAFVEDAPALALKILPRELALLPEPRPAFEIFVVSPRVQGVHLRFGPVARGGLRWSDRKEDFRTEVLGLVKAQMVKNTVIVPVGAKGGFVPMNLPDARTDRAGWLAEGVACYEIFITSLLSVTDNMVDGAVVPPEGVVRYDADDAYLVVAADKGTAALSDNANAISLARGFWLGDAFASGGSVGYDHKKMGITARGAWESVKRHFYEMGVDCQAEDFTCVGVGDMAGDVFGNGMLRSEHTKLVAAFNHLHVFLDPDPDPAASFAERARLAALPRSSWADYDPSVISAGGGVYERTRKAIPVSDQVREVLGIDDGVTELTPPELISAILRAPVDLVWNGGIGTYVKASFERNEDVGDKANDAVRVDGGQVRAKIAGEGGNLGWTQHGRIEYAMAGGRINTDFIDNSAGVDTSDHEVNIKILLQPAVKAGELDADARVELLESMTEDVARHVLEHNVDSNRALAAGALLAVDRAEANESWMRELEASGHLDRELEGLPSSEEMARRIDEGRRLTRPEYATLLAYTKIRLSELVIDSTLPDDPYLADRLSTYFPKPLRERFADAMRNHPLRREIVSTVTVNRFVNSQGPSAYNRLATETQSDIDRIVRAQLAARTIFRVAGMELSLPKLDVDAATETGVRVSLQRMVERAARWLLHNRRGHIDITREANRFTTPIGVVVGLLPGLLSSAQRAVCEEEARAMIAAGVSEDVAGPVSTARLAHLALPIVDTALDLGRDPAFVAGLDFTLAQELGLDIVMERVDALERRSRWETMARAALRYYLQALQAQLTRDVLQAAPEASGEREAIDAWRAGVKGTDEEVRLLAEACDGPVDLARMSVALRVVRSLLT